MQETDNPDLRDRAYVYWRLLSTDPEAAKEVVLAEKPIITNSAYNIEPALVDVLLKNIATIASVYHKPPEVNLHALGLEAVTDPVLKNSALLYLLASPLIACQSSHLDLRMKP